MEHIRQSHLFCPALISCWQRGNWIVTDRAIREGGNFFLIGQSSSSLSMARSSSSLGQEATFSLLPMAQYNTFFYNTVEGLDFILPILPPCLHFLFSLSSVEKRQGRGFRIKTNGVFQDDYYIFLGVNIFQG